MKKGLLLLIILTSAFELKSQNHVQLSIDSICRIVSKKQLKKGNISPEKIMLLAGIVDYEKENIDTFWHVAIFHFDSLALQRKTQGDFNFIMDENKLAFFALLKLLTSDSTEKIKQLFTASFEHNLIYPRALLKNKINYDIPKDDLMDIFLLDKKTLENTNTLKFKGKNFLNRVAYELFFEIK